MDPQESLVRTQYFVGIIIVLILMGYTYLVVKMQKEKVEGLNKKIKDLETKLSSC